MPDRLKSLLDFLKSASAGSRLIAALVAVAVIGILGIAGYFANRPDYQVLYSRLGDREHAAVCQALAEAGIPFETSQPPGPYVVQVDASSRTQALFTIFSAGATQSAPEGIPTGVEGMSGVFMSHGEREQAMRKREWAETEALLESLEFVERARVGTNAVDRSPLRKSDPITASVTLTLRGTLELDRDQAGTVAKLVRFRLGVEERNLIVSDQDGHSLWDGSHEADSSLGSGEWLQQLDEHDRGLEERANLVLTDILGPNRARVVVASSWDTDQKTVLSRTSDPNSAVPLTEEETSTKTPQLGVASVGGAAGTAANLGSGFGIDSAGVAQGAATPAPASSGTPPTATDTTKHTQYMVDQTTTQSVRIVPALERLSVSLFIDESIAAERIIDLAAAAQAAVGFDELRGDVFNSFHYPFHIPEPGVEAPLEAPLAVAEPNPMLELLLERGVEILSALAFLFIAFKSLRGRGQKAVETPVVEEQIEEEIPIDPEALARAQIEELVKSHPARVGNILSGWAISDRHPVGSGR